jgi:hypothetical protein
MADPKDKPAEALPVDESPFTPEEQAQFDLMQKETAEPTGEPAPEGTEDKPKPAVEGEAPKPVIAGAKDPAEGGEGDDDEDGEEPAAGAEAKPGEEDKPPPRRVAYGKFQRVENAKKKAEADLKAEREARQKDAEERARLDERLKLINEALQPRAEDAKAKAAAEDPAPDPEADIFAYVAWQGRQIERLNTTIQDIQQGGQQRDDESAIAQTYVSDAEQFAGREPNFIPAYQFLMQSRTLELAQYFFGKDLTDPETPRLTGQEYNRIKTTVADEERQLAKEAIRAGQSPAARVFSLAKARGFRPGAPRSADPAPDPAAAAAAAAANGGAKTNGTAAPAGNGGTAAPGSLAVGAAAPAPGAPAKPSVKDEIEKIRQGTEASVSLSQGGGAPTSPMTPERLANMPQHEFEALMDRLSPAEQRIAMGGG